MAVLLFKSNSARPVQAVLLDGGRRPRMRPLHGASGPADDLKSLRQPILWKTSNRLAARAIVSKNILLVLVFCRRGWSQTYFGDRRQNGGIDIDYSVTAVEIDGTSVKPRGK